MQYVNTFILLLGEMAPYLLLGFLIAGLLHAFVPSRVYSKHLASNNWWSVVKAAAFGVPLPLCSCGVLPTAVSLRNNGASKGASTSFLIATPQTGIDSIAATYSLLGMGFAVIRPIAALVTAMIGGIAVNKATKNDLPQATCELTDDCDDDEDCCCCGNNDEARPATFVGKLLLALKYGYFDMMKSMGKWLFVGLIVASVITVFVPNDLFAALAQYPLLNMFVVLAIAVPMYVCATGSIPIALSLMLKGLTPGAAFVLLMAGPAANFASVLIVSKSFGKVATRCYLASIIGGAISFGLLIDYVLPVAWFEPRVADVVNHAHCLSCLTWLDALCGAILALLVLVAFASKWVESIKIKKNKSIMTKEFKIKGMMCAHCQASAQKAIAAVEGVKSVTIDLASGTAYVEGDVNADAVKAAVENAGFEFVG